MLYFIFTVFLQFFILNSSQFASGTDGYYYAYQIKSMHEKGVFSAPESSLTLYYLYFFSLAVKNIVLSNKIAVSFLKGFLVLEIYSAVSNLHDRKTGAAAAVLSSSCLMINFFTCEYVKSLGAMVLFVFFINSMLLLDKNHGIKYYIFSACLFFSAALSHKVTAVFSLITVLAFFSVRIKKKHAAAAAVFLISALAVFSVFVPNSLHYLDFQRFSGYFSLKPYLHLKSFFLIMHPGTVSKFEVLLLYFFPLIIFPYILLSHKKNIYLYSAMMAVFMICINPFSVFESLDVAFRLFIFLFIPSVFILSVALSKLKLKYILPFLILIIPLHVYNTKKSYLQFSHDYELYSDIIPLLNLPENSLLIVHQGFDYLYWYETGKKAFHYMPEAKHMNRPLYRLAFGVKRDLFEKYTDSNTGIRYLPGFYALIEEKDWQSFLTKIPENERHRFNDWRNPGNFRENFLLRNQKFRKK